MNGGASLYYPANRNSARGQTIGPRRVNFDAIAAQKSSGLSGLGAFGALNDVSGGLVLSGTPTQIQAMVAANANVPQLSDSVSYDDATLNAAVATITSIPQVPKMVTVPIPAKSGITFAATGLSGLGAYRGNIQHRSTLSGLGAGTVPYGAIASVAGASAQEATDISIGASIGAFAGPWGAAIGAVVGAIVGLFHKKVVSPPTTQAQIQASQQFITWYEKIAGTCIGRAFTTTQIQDMVMAFCINGLVQWQNAGGCGDQEGIQNTWNEHQYYIKAFFTGMQNTAVGSQVVLRDNPSLLGRGKTNTSITFSFPNPGVQAPNYILGPLFAQYYYVMCNIFNSEYSCQGLHLTSPVPQFYCDFVDWYRSAYPAWDIPAGTIDAPVQYEALSLAPGQVTTAASTASIPVLTLAASGINPNVVGASLVINADGTAAESGGTVNTALSTANPILGAGNSVASAAGATTPVSQPVYSSGITASLGLSDDDIWLAAAGAVLLLILYKARH